MSDQAVRPGIPATLAEATPSHSLAVWSWTHSVGIPRFSKTPSLIQTPAWPDMRLFSLLLSPLSMSFHKFHSRKVSMLGSQVPPQTSPRSHIGCRPLPPFPDADFLTQSGWGRGGETVRSLECIKCQRPRCTHPTTVPQHSEGVRNWNSREQTCLVHPKRGWEPHLCPQLTYLTRRSSHPSIWPRKWGSSS